MCRRADQKTSEFVRSGCRRPRTRTRREASLLQRVAGVLAEHELTMEPEGSGALAEKRIVERSQRVRLALLRLPVLAQLQQHQLADRVDEVRRIERAALGLAPRAALFHECFFAEAAYALFDGEIFGVQLDAHDEPDETDQRLRELTELDAVILPGEARLDHHLLAVVRPA